MVVCVLDVTQPPHPSTVTSSKNVSGPAARQPSASADLGMQAKHPGARETVTLSVHTFVLSFHVICEAGAASRCHKDHAVLAELGSEQ